MRFLLLFLVLLLAPWPVKAAQLNFERGGFWLVNPAPAEVALRGEGVATARLALYRLSDPALLAQVLAARASRSLSEAELLRRVTVKLPPLWQAELALDPAATTALPVPLLAAAPDSLDGLAPGVYVLTAAADTDIAIAQWFVKSSLSLAVHFVGNHAFVTAFDSAARTPRGGAVLRWIGPEGQAVGEPVTLPDSGAALLDQPDGAVLLLASAPGNQNPVTAADLDFATVPVRNQTAVPGAALYPATDVAGKMTLLIAAGGSTAPTVMAGKAPVSLSQPLPGLWQGMLPVEAGPLDVTAQRDEQVLATARLTPNAGTGLPVTWLQKPTALFAGQPALLRFRLSAGFAHRDGALRLQPVGPEHPAVQKFQTDSKGFANVTLDPAALQLSMPGDYKLAITIADRTTAAQDLAVWPAQSWLELTPQFADAVVPENVSAGFVARLRDANGATRAIPIEWELSREAYSFEWYQAEDGRWLYRTKSTLAPVTSGTATPVRDETTFTVPVAAGRYRLTVKAGALAATQSFTAGWWLSPVPAATPESIELAAQTEAAPDGSERIAIFIDPPFAARVWLAGLNAGGAAPVQLADVPDEGSFIYLPRSAMPAGQPLTLLAFAVPRDPGATLVRAEALVSLPLGPSVSFLPVSLLAGRANDLTIGKLPVGVTVLLTLVNAGQDGTEKLLWQSTAQTAQGDGTVHYKVPALPIGATPQVRLFIAHDEKDAGRLDIVEHVFPVTAAAKAPAVGKSRH